MEQNKSKKQEKIDIAKAMMASIISAGYEMPSVTEIATSRANPETEKPSKTSDTNEAADALSRRH